MGYFSEHYFDAMAEEHKCSCGWVGQGNALAMGELFDDRSEWHCPACHEKLLVVLHPTIEEYRANWDKLDDRERRSVESHEQFWDQFRREMLRSPDDLPDVSDSSFVLTWDRSADPNSRRTLIKLGDRVIFSEPEVWEGYERFEEVAEILKAKYGSHLTDLIPTERSETYLYGDKMSAPRFVEDVRRKLFS